MEVVVKVVTEFFMMVLCATSAPVDQQEIRIDLLAGRGYVDTMIVQREEVGFTVHDEMNGKRVKLMTIVPKDGEENVFICTDHKGRSETVDLAVGIKNLNVSKLRTAPRLRLETIDGQSISVNRSGKVSFITSSNQKQTYVVH